MYTLKKVHGGFIGTLLLAAAAMLFFFHTKPIQSRLNTAAEQATQLQSEIQILKGDTKISDTSALSEVERKEIELAIPMTPEQDQIITELNSIATASNVNFSALLFNLDSSSSPGIINVSAGFQGVSANIVDFLKKIETSARRFRVKDASFSRIMNDQGLPIVSLNVTLQAFFVGK